MSSTRYQPGKSGNPAGRPKQITTTAELRKRLSDDMPKILEKLIEMAKSGDTQAIKIILDRTYPSLKPQALPVHIPTDGTLVDQGHAVIQATLSGLIPPDIGSQLITALANQGKLVEINDLAKRIDALENQK